MAEGSEHARNIRRLIGSVDAEVDEKCRITIPSKFRDQLGSEFVAFLSKHNSIHLIPDSTFDKICEDIEQYDPLEESVDFYKRIFYSSCTSSQEYDNQGRYVIPLSFRTKANLFPKSKVKFTGAGAWLEVWNSDEYESYVNSYGSYGQERVELFNKSYARMKATKLPLSGFNVIRNTLRDQEGL